MSGSGSGSRVSIPNNVNKTIQNIKEITGDHSDDDIYTMLKECNMDPNDTVQKLLSQDPFHEVKRKRDRKKEILNKESTAPRWKPGMQGRGNMGGRRNYPSRHISNGASGGRKSLSVQENGINQGAENGPNPPMPRGQKNKAKIVARSSSRVVPDRGTRNTTILSAAHSSVGIVKKQSEVGPTFEARKGLVNVASKGRTVEASKSHTVGIESGSTHGPVMLSSYDIPASKTLSSSLGVGLSDSDPILMPSQDSWLPVGTIRPEVGSQGSLLDEIHETPHEIKSATSGSEVGNSTLQGKAASSHVPLSIARPSSDYNNRLQQAIGPQKAIGPSMEWKPKPTDSVLAQGTVSKETIKPAGLPVEVFIPALSASSNVDSKDGTSGLEKKLEESHISDGQHVIIPNHLHVPEAEKLGFCFGSFDGSFGLDLGSSNGPASDKNSEASEVADESIKEQPRDQNALTTDDEGDHIDRPTSSSNEPKNVSVEGDVALNENHRESNQETSLPIAGHQYSAVQTSPNFSFGFMPPMIGTHLTSFESNESQGRDGLQVPSFVVQQPFDPASYYAQLYRSGDTDGRMSPLHSSGVPTKHNGNVSVLSPQSSQEAGNLQMLPGAGPTPIGTAQPGGVMQSSIAVPQQPSPVFRQQAGVHLPHFPPNYIPYGSYFPPFYVPHPAIHQFMSNGPQPQAGSMYPTPPVAGHKYPLPQYKAASNSGNTAHFGVPGSYGPYGSTHTGYNNGSATTAGNSTSNEDLGGSQFKENNVYITGQQSEGSGVWIGAPGRDMSGLQANSFYNLPQGSQIAYTPTQAGHGMFTSVYQPAQPITTGAIHSLFQQSQTLAGSGVDKMGPTAQINWPNNY